MWFQFSLVINSNWRAHFSFCRVMFANKSQFGIDISWRFVFHNISYVTTHVNGSVFGKERKKWAHQWNFTMICYRNPREHCTYFSNWQRFPSMSIRLLWEKVRSRWHSFLCLFSFSLKCPAKIDFTFPLEGVHLTDEFRDNVNRFKKVPAIVDRGFQLSESVAIFRYIVNRNKIDDQWYPENLQIRARIDEYLEWQHYNTRQTCAQYFMLKYMKPRTIGPSAGDAQIIASAETQMVQSLDMIENLWLRPGCFISGTNQLSFADILAACEIEQPSKSCTAYSSIKKNSNLLKYLSYTFSINSNFRLWSNWKSTKFEWMAKTGTKANKSRLWWGTCSVVQASGAGSIQIISKSGHFNWNWYFSWIF